MEDEDGAEILTRLSDFHGHLGPYVVVGYRMGKIANREIGEDPFEKKALALTGRDPPVSCIVDGVQFSSGCTLGKGNIEVRDEGVPSVEFSGSGKALKITLKEKVQKRIEEVIESDLEEISKEVFEMSEDDLLSLSEGTD